jgi:hypothetical protein
METSRHPENAVDCTQSFFFATTAGQTAPLAQEADMVTIRRFVTATWSVFLLLALVQPARANTGSPGTGWRPSAAGQTQEPQLGPDAQRSDKPGVVQKTGKAEKIIKRRRIEVVHKVDRLKPVKVERVSRSLGQNKRRVRTSLLV